MCTYCMFYKWKRKNKTHMFIASCIFIFTNENILLSSENYILCKIYDLFPFFGIYTISVVSQQFITYIVVNFEKYHRKKLRYYKIENLFELENKTFDLKCKWIEEMVIITLKEGSSKCGEWEGACGLTGREWVPLQSYVNLPAWHFLCFPSCPLFLFRLSN